ncbi:MAG: cupin domain-containing protein [bacterium]
MSRSPSCWESPSRRDPPVDTSFAGARPPSNRGGRFSWHEHPHPQCFYFVKGEGEVQLKDKAIAVSEGSMVTLDDREGHEIRNTGPGEMFLMEVSLFHAEGAVPKVEPHPGIAPEEERVPGRALQLHGAVRRGVREAAADTDRPRSPRPGPWPSGPATSRPAC